MRARHPGPPHRTSSTPARFALLAGAIALGWVACGDDAEEPPATATVAGTGGSGGAAVTTVGTGGGCTEATCIGEAPQGGCDDDLDLDSGDGMDGARAIGLCRDASDGGWGVIEATFQTSAGEPLTGGDGGMFEDGTVLQDGRGLLPKFGELMPREGGAMLALSSGTARDASQPDFYDPIGN